MFTKRGVLNSDSLCRKYTWEGFDIAYIFPPDLSQDVHVNDVTLQPPVPVVPLEGDATDMEVHE